MPFTFSHPAAVMPLLFLPRRWRSATGLIIGSMAPDFEKFIRMSTYDPFSHTWRSIFYFNLPLGLLLAFVFHFWVRDALLAHSPAFVQQRFVRLRKLDWWAYFKQHYLIVLFSLLIGTVSHIFWDSFTHEHGRGVDLFPFLAREVQVGGDQMPVYRLLQTISSVLGLAVALYFFFRKPRQAFYQPLPTVWSYWAGTVLVTGLIFGMKAVVGQGIDFQELDLVAVVGIAAGLWGLVVVSAYFKSKLQL